MVLLCLSAASSSAPARGHVVVVGAGPAGVAAALHLAAAGYSIDVLERRGHPKHATADMKRTYLIGLGETAGWLYKA
jgi:glycine/D-amino acid oxidase-like deaminating enzyme